MGYFRHINLLKAFPGASMSGTYTVVSSIETKRGTSKSGHDYVVYDLTLDDGMVVGFTQGPQKPPPGAGDRIEGSISEQFGKMQLKRERLAPQQATTATGAPSGRHDAATHESIVRQVCMKAAAPIMQAKIMKAGSYSILELKNLLEWLYKWAEGQDPPPYS